MRSPKQLELDLGVEGGWHLYGRMPTWRDLCYVHVVTDGGKPRCERWKPSIPLLCDALFGASIKEGGQITGVLFPSFGRCVELFHEGLDLIEAFRDRNDLLVLASYRRQVTELESCPEVDGRFLRLAENFEPQLSEEEWRTLAERMPARAAIKTACLTHAAVAAEAPTEVSAA